MSKNFHHFIKIGCDPELFAYNTKTSKFVSVHDLIPGTKLQPRKIPLGAIQVDGVAAEFNIEPASNKAEWLRNINNVRRLLEAAVKKKDSDLTLVATPTATFDPDYFFKLPEETLALGCEPDYSAYTMMPNPKPQTNEAFRTGSGHIHIQFLEDSKFVNDVTSDEHMEKCSQLVQALDTTLLPLAKLWDQDVKRMELYGKPGAFRPKPYGVEYRSLSNAWLNHDWSRAMVYDVAKATTNTLLSGVDIVNSIVSKLANTNKSIRTLCRVLEHEGIPSALNYCPELVPQEI